MDPLHELASVIAERGHAKQSVTKIQYVLERLFSVDNPSDMETCQVYRERLNDSLVKFDNRHQRALVLCELTGRNTKEMITNHRNVVMLADEYLQRADTHIGC